MWLRIGLGTAVSLTLVWFASRNVDWPNAWRRIITSDPLWLAMALGSVWLTTLIKAIRWRLMFYPQGRELSLRNFGAAFLVGQMVNTVIPFRLGELLRAYLIGQSERVSQVRAVWTTLLEKVLDSVVLLAFVAGLSLSMVLPPWLGRAAWILGGALVLSMLVVALMLPLRATVERALLYLETRYALAQRMRLSHIWRETVVSLSVGHDPKVAVGLFAWSLAAFLLSALTNWLTGRALNMAIGWEASLLLLSVLQMSAVVPVPTLPGRVGLFHYLCVLCLSLFGVERGASMGYAVVLHVLVYAPIMVGGPLGTWALHLRWHEMNQLLRGATSTPLDREMGG
ncbi:MAG: flippase-like domain-containing protein [Anaerolineae bacterium]|nr:flippase-like domain-containing protein [Anaerolineae bacterium]